MQILVGAGDQKAGATRILFDTSLSERGALLCVRKAPRAANVLDFNAQGVIHNPNALPMYREEMFGQVCDTM